MAFHNKSNKRSSKATASQALDQVTEVLIEDRQAGIEKSKSKGVSSHLPRPPAPERPNVAAKPKRKPPPPPAKPSRSSLSSSNLKHAQVSLHTDRNVDSPPSSRESHTEPSVNTRLLNDENSQPEGSVKPPPPLPKSPPSKSRLALSSSSSKFSPCKNSPLSKSESQNSISSSEVSVTSTPVTSPVSSPLHCLSTTPVSPECAPSISTVKPTHILSSDDSCSSKPSSEQSDLVSTSNNQGQSSSLNSTSAIADHNKDSATTSPLEIDVTEDEVKTNNGFPAKAEALKKKTPPPVPKKSPKRGAVSATAPPSSSPSQPAVSPPARPPPPSRASPHKHIQSPPLPTSRKSFPQGPSTPPLPCDHGTSPGLEEPRNVTEEKASDQDLKCTETGISETDSKSDPPPLPKNPPRRGLLKKQRSVTNDVKSKVSTHESIKEASSVRAHVQTDSLNVRSNLDLKEGNEQNTQENSLCLLQQGENDNNSFQEVLKKEASSEAVEVERESLSLNSSEDIAIRNKAPRPVPRKRLSIPCSLTDSELSVRAKDLNSSESFFSSEPLSSETQVEYAEVYVSKQESSEGGEKTEEETLRSDDSSSPSDNLHYCAIDELIGPSQNSQHVLDVEGKIKDHGNPLSQEEPEATSDMLKEIEELLLSKLGTIDIGKEIEHTPLDSPETGFSAGSLEEDTPRRPPRPKREAKRKASFDTIRSLSVDSPGSHSASSVDLQLTSVNDSENKKVAPQKPKRMTLPRVNRSQSDVSGMKDIFNDLDSSAPFTSNSSLNSESDKPVLPPRSESLKKGYSTLSSIPPPLPPRNKPRTVSSPMINTLSGSKSDSVPSHTVSTNMSIVNSCDDGTASLTKLSPSQIRSKTASLRQKREGLHTAGTAPAPKRQVKPRPLRKAPPPPVKPKRNATFSSGDKHLAAAAELSSPDSDAVAQQNIPGKQKKEITANGQPPGEAQDKSSEFPTKGIVKNLGSFFQAKSSESETAKPLMRKTCVVKSAQVDNNLNQAKEDKDSYSSEGTEKTQEGKLESASDSRTSEGASSTESSTKEKSPRTSSGIDSQSDTEGEKGDEEGANGPNSSSSDSEGDAEAEEIYQSQKKAKKIFNIAKEIASSERVFVDVLRLLNIDFRLHISKEAEKYDQPIIPSENLNKILHFLPQLQDLNENLLKDLEQRISTWNDNPYISDIFVKKGPFLKLYSSYISNFEDGLTSLDECCKKYPRFGAAVKDFEMSPRCAKLALKHYMLKPVQRIPQYKLLFTDYLKHISIDSPDFKPTKDALDIVSNVADHANQSMRNQDKIQKLLEIQRTLIGQFEVIQPGRELIKQGELMKLSRKEMQPRMFFLFSDVLLYTTPVTTGYKLNNILQLSRMQVEVPKLEEFKYEVNIIGKERSFTVCASTEKEKEEWLEALTKAIDQKRKNFESYAKHSEADEKSQGEEFVLGQKAPVWQNDKKVTMCTLCLEPFTITWRRHHCRACGKIFCHYCSENKYPLPYLDYKPDRVCDICFEKLSEASRREEVDHGGPDNNIVIDEESGSSEKDSEESKGKNGGGAGFDIKKVFSFFHKTDKNRPRKKSASAIPSVLKEVHANDEDTDISGYLRAFNFKNRKWKRQWFVVKSNVIYTFNACEDRAAAESMPLLGYEIIAFTTSFEGAEPDCLFELVHQNNQRLTSNNKGPASPISDKNMQRYILRADSKTSSEKWISVITAATHPE